MQNPVVSVKLRLSLTCEIGFSFKTENLRIRGYFYKIYFEYYRVCQQMKLIRNIETVNASGLSIKNKVELSPIIFFLRFDLSRLRNVHEKILLRHVCHLLISKQGFNNDFPTSPYILKYHGSP